MHLFTLAHCRTQTFGLSHDVQFCRGHSNYPYIFRPLLSLAVCGTVSTPEKLLQARLAWHVDMSIELLPLTVEHGTSQTYLNKKPRHSMTHLQRCFHTVGCSIRADVILALKLRYVGLSLLACC